MKKFVRCGSSSLLVLSSAVLVGAASGVGARHRRRGQGARHGVPRGADLGRSPRSDQGRHDQRHHRHRGHRAEGPAHGGRRAQVRHGVHRRQDRARDRQDAGRAGRDLRARRQLGEPGGHMAKPGTITLPDDRFVELLVNAGPQPEGRRLQDHPVHRRVGRQPQRHADRGREAERAVEGRGDARVLDRRLLHQGARRSEHVRHREGRRFRRPDRQPRQHPRHLRAAVRQRRSTFAATA